MTTTSYRRRLIRAGTAVLAVAGAALIINSAAPEAAAAANACGNPVLATDLHGWGSLDGAAVSRDPVGDLAGASWAFATTAHVLQVGAFGTATGTDFKATKCDYQLGATPTPTAADVASIRYAWGTPVASQSDEYNGTAVDLAKWGLFGAAAGERTGCTEGYLGHGQRCAAQTTEGGGYLSVAGTAGGVTGGLYARTRPFRYGRVEVRERAVQLTGTGGRYGAVPLLWPRDEDKWQSAEIDFAERPVGDPTTSLFVHHDDTQSSCPLTIDSTAFHNYAVDWQPGSITWYVDAVRICTVTASVPYFTVTNGGAQLDMVPASGPMRAARQDVDWIRMFPNAYTQYL